MEISQAQAQLLISALKEAVRKNAFTWDSNTRFDEPLVAVASEDLEFVLSLNRNPFEIRLHLRTQKDNIGLCRVDAAPYHPNPDGSEIRDTPHMHFYKEGYGLKWAEPIDWYYPSDPEGTLKRFLDVINTRFINGIQTTLL